MAGDQETKLPVEVAQKFLANQEKELEIKLQQVYIQSEDIQNQKEYALASLEANAKDRQEIREAIQTESTKSKRFTLGILVIIAVFILSLVFFGESSLARDIIDIATKAGLGVVGGYGIARWQMRDFVPREAPRNQ